MKMFTIIFYLCCIFGLSQGDWSMCKEARETDFDSLWGIDWHVALRLGDDAVYPCEIWKFGNNRTIKSISSPRGFETLGYTLEFTAYGVGRISQEPTVTPPPQEGPAALLELFESTNRLCFITDPDHHIIAVLHDGGDNISEIYVLLKSPDISVDDFLSIYNGSVASDLFPRRPYTVTTCPASSLQ